MADEEQKRRRGRRRGGRPAGQPDAGDSQPESVQPADTGAPAGGVVPSAGGGGSEPAPRARRERARPKGGGSADVSPMDFWRSGQARSHRERPVSTVSGPRGIWKRLTNMYFPPWVPVVAIIVVVFGILGLLFVTRNATGAPRIGKDHWHAPYTFYACGEKQPPAPTWEGPGVHTHGDGVIHIHPFIASEEGQGARLVKWFEYGGGKLTSNSIRMPGFAKEYKNGDVCPEGTLDAGQTGKLQISVNSVKLSDWSRYIPKDGDRIRMEFGPESAVTQLDDRTVLDENPGLREVDITVSGNKDNEAATAFAPASIQVKTGETIKVVVTNTGDLSHGLRFAGTDAKYGTGDDFVVVPTGSDPKTANLGDVITPGGTGFAIVRFDDPGQVEFKDPTATNASTDPPQPFATGTVVVTETGTGTPAPTASAAAEVAVEMQDNVFVPDALTVPAGGLFKIALTNTGQFVHNLRIAGPDGIFETADDITSPDIDGSATGELTGTITDKGDYKIRDDFHPEMTGTLTVN